MIVMKSSISGLPNDREIAIANQAKKGDISDIFEINNSLADYLLESRMKVLL